LKAARNSNHGNGSDGERRKNGLYIDRASASTVTRLSSYYRLLGEFERESIETISSERLAERGGVTSAQVRKDLSFFGNFGRRGLGYNVRALRGQLAEILGLTRRWSVALVGAGNLGQALFAYKEFQKQGFFIEHVFDVDPAKVGQTWDSVRIATIAELPQRAAEGGIDIAIVAVPVQAAQGVADAVVKAGIRAILNFAPGTIVVPDGVSLRNVDLSIAMESLSYALVK
jgi:redox-sensing transcriptional repressor